MQEKIDMAATKDYEEDQQEKPKFNRNIKIVPKFWEVNQIQDSVNITPLENPRIFFVYETECATIQLSISALRIQMDRYALADALAKHFKKSTEDQVFPVAVPSNIEDILAHNPHWPSERDRMLLKITQLIDTLR